MNDDENNGADAVGYSLPRVAAMLFGTPLMIAPNKLDVILNVLGPRLQFANAGKLAAAVSDKPKRAITGYQITNDGIAIIPITGTLVHRGGFLDAESGLMSYAIVQNRIVEALDNNAVAGLLLDIDSFGGSANAVMDLSDLIYKARGTKPIVAVANEFMYSAAYAIGSAADQVYLSRSAGVGSIGVRAVHVDQSAYDEKSGLVYTAVYAGKRKNDFDPHRPLDSEALKVLQGQVDESYTDFVNTVARNRGLTAEAVRRTEAATYIGRAALKAGIADQVVAFADAYQLTVNLSKRKGGNSMTQHTTTTEPGAGEAVPGAQAGGVVPAVTTETPAEPAPDAGSGEDAGAGEPTPAEPAGGEAAPDAGEAGGGEPAAEPGEGGGEPAPAEAGAAQPATTAKGGNVVDIESARKDGKAAGRNEAVQIIGLCNTAGVPGMAAQLIAEGVGIDEARNRVFAGKAAAQQQTDVSSHVAQAPAATPAAGWDSAFSKLNETR